MCRNPAVSKVVVIFAVPESTKCVFIAEILLYGVLSDEKLCSGFYISLPSVSFRSALQ